MKIFSFEWKKVKIPLDRSILCDKKGQSKKLFEFYA